MMIALRIMNGMVLKVHLPMILYVDNKGANDFGHNWSVGGRTRHIEVKQYFLRKLRKAGIIECRWKSGNKMRSDIFIKNCPGLLFEKHASKFVCLAVFISIFSDATTYSKKV
eukprot:10117733-Ditylum_brightwellii.AAC.1